MSISVDEVTKGWVYNSALQLRARHCNFTYIVSILPTLTTCLDYLPTVAWLMTACMGLISLRSQIVGTRPPWQEN
jgi:hypothetical protein